MKATDLETLRVEKDAETLALERELEDLARQILEVGDLKFLGREANLPIGFVLGESLEEGQEKP